MALEDKVAGAWVNFAKTGNPSQPGLEWRPYTPDNPQAMVFDTISESRPLHDDKLVSMLPPPPGRGSAGGAVQCRGQYNGLQSWFTISAQ